MIKSIHPFPARMAPELAINSLKNLKTRSVVLDPMMGSGVVVRQASKIGHQAIGLDIDPLAVLMTKVWTTPINDAKVEILSSQVLKTARSISSRERISWIDDDEETSNFVRYWFAEPQQLDLRRLALSLSQLDHSRASKEKRAAADVLRLALSRIIITKELGASLARDVSHSRPHKVSEVSNFEVMPAFERSVRQIRHLLLTSPPIGNVDVKLGDARSLKSIENGEVDVVLTSPPYLNAIDYMRGHRLSLVWLGHRLSDLRNIRSNSIGAERGPDRSQSMHLFREISRAMVQSQELQNRHTLMVARYAEDLYLLMSEISRVLRPKGKAILVVGNSCLKNAFIRNSEGVKRAASMVGLKFKGEIERELPAQSRYLPMPSNSKNPLAKRMKTESILTFVAM